MRKRMGFCERATARNTLRSGELIGTVMDLGVELLKVGEVVLFLPYEGPDLVGLNCVAGEVLKYLSSSRASACWPVRRAGPRGPGGGRVQITGQLPRVRGGLQGCPRAAGGAGVVLERLADRGAGVLRAAARPASRLVHRPEPTDPTEIAFAMTLMSFPRGCILRRSTRSGLGRARSNGFGF